MDPGQFWIRGSFGSGAVLGPGQFWVGAVLVGAVLGLASYGLEQLWSNQFWSGQLCLGQFWGVIDNPEASKHCSKQSCECVDCCY